MHFHALNLLPVKLLVFQLAVIFFFNKWIFQKHLLFSLTHFLWTKGQTE